MMYLFMSAVVLAVLALEGQAQHVPCCLPKRWTGALHQSLRFARRDSPTYGYRSVSIPDILNFSYLGYGSIKQLITARIQRMRKEMFSICLSAHTEGREVRNLHPVIPPLVPCPLQEVPQ